MTIEVKIAKNGRINAKVNGKCVAINTLSELVGKSLRNNEQVELIASDGHKFTCTGYELYEFAHPLCRRDSFNFMDDAGNTFPAYTMTDAIYTVDKFASGEYKTRNIFAEYAVTEDAMDIATEAEIENAQANDVKVTEQDNSNVTIEAVNPERFSATVYYYRPDENGGEPWHGDKYQQFATAADAANFIIKFAAGHYDYTITTDSNIRDWDNRKQYWLTDADFNALAADAFVKTTRQADALKDKIARDANASDDDNVFDLLPDVDDLPDVESEWQYWQGIYAQINREQGNFTAQIGVATVTFRDWQIVEICDGFTSYKKVNGNRQYRISGRLVSRKEFEEYALYGTDDKPEPPTPPTGIYDELLNTPVTDKSERIEALADAINENRDAWHEADFLLTVAKRQGDTKRADELKTFMGGCIADAYQLNNALDNLIKPHTPPTYEAAELTRAQKIAADIAAMLKGHHCHFVYAEKSGVTTCNGKPLYKGLKLTYSDDPECESCRPTEYREFFTDDTSYILDYVIVTIEGSTPLKFDFPKFLPPDIPTVEPAAYTPQVAEWVDPHQYGTPGNLEHVRRTDITEFNAHIGDDIVTYINGKFYGVHSLKYGAYFEIVDGEPRFWANPRHYGSDKFHVEKAVCWDEEDWFDIMVTRGACIIGEPADDFNSQLAELTAAAKAAHAAEKNAMHELDKACDTYHKAEETWRQARLHMRDAEFAVEQFLAGKAKELRDNLLDNDIFDATIAIIAQDGKRFDEPELGQIWIDFRGEESQLIIFSSWNKNFAIYDTPAQVTAVIGRLRDAIERGATEFKFPTIGELNKQTTANKWRTVRTKTNPRNVNLTVQNKARANA